MFPNISKRSQSYAFHRLCKLERNFKEKKYLDIHAESMNKDCASRNYFSKLFTILLSKQSQ